MAIAEKAKKMALNIVEFILNFIILGIAANKYCLDCANAIRSQFADAIVFGFFIVNAYIFASIFIEEQEFDKKMRAVISISACVLFLVAGALILDYANYFGFGGSSYASCITAVGVLCLIMFVLYLAETVLIFTQNE